MVDFTWNDPNVICSKKRNMSRCCLPGASVNDVIDVVREGTVKKGDKVILWIGTNEVGKATNSEFKRETTTLLRETKARSKDITVLGLLPRFPGWRSRKSVEEQRLNAWMNARALSMNKVLKEVCERENVNFIDLFCRRKEENVTVFQGCQVDWMARDKLHLSSRGVNEVGKLLLHNLASKN